MTQKKEKTRNIMNNHLRKNKHGRTIRGKIKERTKWNITRKEEMRQWKNEEK